MNIPLLWELEDNPGFNDLYKYCEKLEDMQKLSPKRKVTREKYGDEIERGDLAPCNFGCPLYIYGRSGFGSWISFCCLFVSAKMNEHHYIMQQVYYVHIIRFNLHLIFLP